MAAVTLSEVLSAKSIICDIEGTTTSISFVKDQLFPYVLKNLEEYLKNNWNEDSTKTVIAALREQADEDKKAELDGVILIPTGDSEEIIPDIVKNVEWQMSQDRKTGSLKTLQGLVWDKGYKDGTIKGHVYEDVQKSFEKWTESGRKIYIYSSGSVDAQKLLFENSEQGNLLEYLAGHYDTKIGAKREKESYQSILKNIDAAAEDTLFLTDVFAEAKAAKEAGLHVVLLDRPGNAELTEDERKEFPVIKTFSDLSFVEAKEAANGSALNGKRKIEEATENIEEDQAQEPPSKVVKVEEGNKEEAPANGAGDDDKEMVDAAVKVDSAVETKKAEEVPEKKADEMEVDSAKANEEGKEATDNVENEQKSVDKMEEDTYKVKSDADDKSEKVDSKTDNDKMKANTQSAAAMDVDEQDSATTKEEEVKQDSVPTAEETNTTEEPKKEANSSCQKVVEDKEANLAKAGKVEEDAKDSKKDESTKESINVADDKDTVEKETPADAEKVDKTPKETTDTAETETAAKDEDVKKDDASEKKVESAEATTVEVATGVETEPSAPVDEVATEVKPDEKTEKTPSTNESEKECNKTNGDVTEPQPASDKAPSTNDKETDSSEAKVAVTNGEKTEDKPSATTTNGSSSATGEEEKNGDSDKENDTSSTNCEVDDVATAVAEKTNGSTTVDGSSSSASSVQEAAATSEIKPKKVVDVAPAVTPTPPIEAES